MTQLYDVAGTIYYKILSLSKASNLDKEATWILEGARFDWQLYHKNRKNDTLGKSRYKIFLFDISTAICNIGRFIITCVLKTCFELAFIISNLTRYQEKFYNRFSV